MFYHKFVDSENEIEETPSLPTCVPPADQNSRDGNTTFVLQTEAGNQFATTATLITPPPVNQPSPRIKDETNNSAAGKSKYI